MYSFAGVRIRPQALEFHDPKPPPDTSSVKLVHFDYQRASFDIDINRQRVLVKMVSVGEFPLVLQLGVTKEVKSLSPGWNCPQVRGIMYNSDHVRTIM